jgi:hypothetical protein
MEDMLEYGVALTAEQFNLVLGPCLRQRMQPRV